MRRVAFVFSLMLFLGGCKNWNVDKINPSKVINEKSDSLASQYDTVPNDPSKTRIYKLENGLTIYLSPNKISPRVHTVISVNAGSVHDPADATGLAHYLEHMLFKGTDRIGTIDFEKENALIQQIEGLFEQLRATKDTVKRVNIYTKIDSLSQEAGKFAAPNELTQLYQSIGASKTNAFTSNDYTGYINDLPSNQIENWLRIEDERFRNPVLRLFHTELEAVYEEKNMGLDNPDRTAYYTMMEALFPTHNYGQQTTIGTVEHLKSPSMKEIHKFYKKHYVPNNMAVHISGDIDLDSTYQLIKKYFGDWTPSYVELYQPAIETPITSKKVVRLESTEAPNLAMAYRFNNQNQGHQNLAIMVDMILSNSQAGLIDLNINQPKKAIGAYSYHYPLKDYTLHVMGGEPTEGQTLEELEILINEQIQKIKNGDFPDWLLDAIVNNMKTDELVKLRSNKARTYATLDAFSKGLAWEEKLAFHEELSKITKSEIIDFVNKYYNDNYVAVYRAQVDSVTRLSVPKPPITPISGNEQNQSEFTKAFYKNNITKSIQPEFKDISSLLEKVKLANTAELLYKVNTRDELFDFKIYYPTGSNTSNTLSLATDLLQRSGTDSLTAKQISELWYKMGVDFSVGVSDDETVVSLKGLTNQVVPSLNLLNHLVANCKPDSTVWKAVLKSAVQSRMNALASKDALMWTGLRSYLVYGENSPLNAQLSNAQLLKVTTKDLLTELRIALKVPHRFTYYGKHELPKLEEEIKNYFDVESTFELPTKGFERLATTQTEIFFMDQTAQQAEILMLSDGAKMDDTEWAIHELFNEYFGGSMSSIVFQEMREKQALAYSVYAGYSSPKKKNEPRYVIGYIGTQADKYFDSMSALFKLLSNLPIDTVSFEQSKKSILQKIESRRVPEYAITYTYMDYLEKGIPLNKDELVYNEIKKLTIKDLQAYYNKYVANQKFRIGIMGPKEVIDVKKLEKFGTVKTITSDALFPY